MTDYLDEIQARADAATPGPWEHVGSYGRIVSGPVQVCRAYGDDGTATPDAAFIAHARTDVPRLVAALRAVEALHRPWKVYGECDCTDEEKADDLTHAYVEEIGSTCNVEAVVCAECCSEGDEYHSEECATYHDHGEGKPICPTRAVIAEHYPDGVPSG